MLYARSPGGAGISAQRVARWRPQVEAAAKQAGVDPDRLEALVFLESAGREDAMAGDTEGAVGLTQILAETGQNLLGMHVDVAKSRRYTRRIRRQLVRGHLLKVQKLRAARAKVDQRFDPRAVAARHRALPDDGQGALQARGPGVRLVPHGHGQPAERPARLRQGHDVNYTQLYFDSTPSATPPPTRSSPRSATTPRTTGGSSAPPGDHAPQPRRRRRARAPRGRPDGQELRRGGAPPAGLDAALHHPGEAQAGVGRRADRRLPAEGARDRAAARRPHGRARRAADALPGPAARGARHRALHRRRGARDLEASRR